MPDIQISDDLGKPVPNVKLDLSHPSSLLNYAKTELLHLVVAPDFIARAPLALSAAAPNPIAFQLALQHDFQLGNTAPEIHLTPSLKAAIRVNTTKDSNLFKDDPFRVEVLSGTLRGREVEYRRMRITCTKAGRRELTIAFEAGQGTQDIGFRGETPVLFDVRP